MNFVADESIDCQIVARLSSDGHGVLYFARMDPGISDDEVLAIANDRNALLHKVDKGFGELACRMGRLHQGVVLLRLSGARPVKSS